MSTNLERWNLVGEKLGYEGKESRNFVFSEQEKEREEILPERDEIKRKEELRKLELSRRENVYVPDLRVSSYLKPLSDI